MDRCLEQHSDTTQPEEHSQHHTTTKRASTEGATLSSTRKGGVTQELTRTTESTSTSLSETAELFGALGLHNTSALLSSQSGTAWISSKKNYEDQLLLPKYRAMTSRMQRSAMDTKKRPISSSPQDAAISNVSDEEESFSCSSCSTARQQQQPQRFYRSVNDFTNEEALRKALSLCCIDEEEKSKKSATKKQPPSATSSSSSSAKGGKRSLHSDWLLSVPDPEAAPQSIETELQRLWTLRSYLALDAAQEPEFDALCAQACLEFACPVSNVSLVDLGRQFAFAAQAPQDLRETPRSSAFCSHTILSKRGMTIVPDTLEDERFRRNPWVVQDPQLRFYAGVPLVSPEGYKLGTFCVEGPEPKPQGLSQEQQDKLQAYASKAMALLVDRKKRLQQEQVKTQHIHKKTKQNVVEDGNSQTAPQDPSPSIPVDFLRLHAGITTNLGGLLYYEGDCVTAMHLFQESVQSLMCLEAYTKQANTTDNIARPSQERHDEFKQLLDMLSAPGNTQKSRKAFCDITRKLFAVPSSHNACSACTVDGFPGLFGHHSSKLKNGDGSTSTDLVFAEPFRIDVSSKDNKETFELKHFIIPLEQCSKATLFNMGLIHYHWGRVDTALQFFDLSSSMSQQLSPLAFDPVILAAFNNMAQIHLQYGRTADAMELLQDALTRGNAALAALYSDERAEWKAQQENGATGEADARRSRRLRRKLARTIMNMGHVHYNNCEYQAAMSTCHDALRLLHPNTEDSEVASVWHNMGILMYHQGEKETAVKYFQMFIDRCSNALGPHHLQLADAYALQGVAIFEMGQLYECMRPHNEGLRIRQIRLGPSHSLIAESLCSIGRVLLAREEYDVCLATFNKGMDMHRATAGPAGLSLETAQTLLDVGRAYHAQNLYEQAIDTYQQVTVLTRRFFGPRSAFVARILILKGNLHLELNQVESALEKFREAMKIHMEQGLPWDYNFVKDPFCRVQHNHALAAAMA